MVFLLENQVELNIFENEKNLKVKILRVIDIEPMIISNTLGMKGKLDLLVMCEYIKNKEIKRAIIPFELKTGEKESQFYIGQVFSF